MNKIIIPFYIHRSFIQTHPEYVFLYGYDVYQKGALGQCVVAVGEPNTYPVPTRWKGCQSSGYFQDSQICEIQPIIDKTINLLKQVKYAIIPFPKIGEGGSRMKELAPECYKYLMEQINKIKYPNIEIDYARRDY